MSGVVRPNSYPAVSSIHRVLVSDGRFLVEVKAYLGHAIVRGRKQLVRLQLIICRFVKTSIFKSCHNRRAFNLRLTKFFKKRNTLFNFQAVKTFMNLNSLISPLMLQPYLVQTLSNNRLHALQVTTSRGDSVGDQDNEFLQRTSDCLSAQAAL